MFDLASSFSMRTSVRTSYVHTSVQYYKTIVQTVAVLVVVIHGCGHLRLDALVTLPASPTIFAAAREKLPRCDDVDVDVDVDVGDLLLLDNTSLPKLVAPFLPSVAVFPFLPTEVCVMNDAEPPLTERGVDAMPAELPELWWLPLHTGTMVVLVVMKEGFDIPVELTLPVAVAVAVAVAVELVILPLLWPSCRDRIPV
jgi:hypothetical protein